MKNQEQKSVNMRNLKKVIKASVNEERSTFPTELRHTLNASTARQSQPPTPGAATPPPPAAAAPLPVRSQTEENASISDGRTRQVFPASQRRQLQTVKKSAAQAKLSDGMKTEPISSVNVNQYIPQEKIVPIAQKKQNLHEIIKKMRKEKTTIENHDTNKTNAESAPAQGSEESADRIEATTALPPSSSFLNQVDFFAAFNIRRPIHKTIRKTAETKANQYGIPALQQQQSPAATTAEEWQKEGAQLLARMHNLSKRPEEEATAEGLHYVQVQPQQPGEVLYAHMHDPVATGYNERQNVGRDAQVQPIRLHGLQPRDFQGFVPHRMNNGATAALLYDTVTTGSDTNTASRPRAGEQAAAAQQALNHSAYAPYPAPMMYNVGPYSYYKLMLLSI